jgi:luciferase family oxidoreductase group 1
MAQKTLADIPFSVLDLVTITEGSTITQCISNSQHLAKAVEQFGYHRYWLAEHHNMDSVASSATAVLIGHMASVTERMRIGSGGIMLPNHSPLMVAEQFGTLASIYPNRIDLGLGRAPGTDQLTARALRGYNIDAAVHSFPNDVVALQRYFSSENASSPVRAIPGEGVDVPIWILGSSTDSAHLAAQLGLPYAFASHFAPTHFEAALEIYRTQFKPSEQLKEPYTLACVNTVVADSSEEAEYLMSSFYQLAAGMVTGKRRPLPAPIDDMDAFWNPQVEAAVRQMGFYSFTGNVQTVKQKLSAFQQRFQLDELMFVSHIYDPQAKVRSYELLQQIKK